MIKLFDTYGVLYIDSTEFMFDIEDAYQQIGIQISRTSYTQIGDGYEVQKDELKAGDLVFFADKRQGVHHVAMYGR